MYYKTACRKAQRHTTRQHKFKRTSPARLQLKSELRVRQTWIKVFNRNRRQGNTDWLVMAGQGESQ